MGPINYEMMSYYLVGSVVATIVLYYKPIIFSSIKEAWVTCISVGLFVHLLFSFNPIPSGSMLNTLEIGDRVVLNCFIYGYGQYNSPFGVLPIKDRIFALRKPKRGEIVVFHSKHDFSKPYVKRLVGMPGEKIQFIDGRLYINNKLCPEIFIRKSKQKRINDIWIESEEYRRSLPGGIEYLFQRSSPRGFGLDNTDAFYLKKDEYFMLGDNMNGSDDSRGNLGVIKYRNIVGRVEMICFSWDGCKRWYQRLFTIRPGRFFTLLWPKRSKDNKK